MFLVKCFETSNSISQPYISYHWQHFAFYTSLSFLDSKCLLVCLNLPAKVQATVLHAVLTESMRLWREDPYSLHSAILNEIFAKYCETVWDARNLVRGTEQDRARQP